METENKLIINFDINIVDQKHTEIVSELANTIYNIDNFLFRTLLLYIIEANIGQNSLNNILENELTIVDEENKSEYVIEIKNGFFCVSIINSSIEEYIGEMVTFQCSEPNDIFVSIIDEDILELNGNENAKQKRKIIIDKMLKSLLFCLTYKIKDTIYTELQLDIFTKLLLSDNILKIVSKHNFEIIKNANPEIITIIWQKLFGEYLKTEDNLKKILNQYYKNDKNIVQIMKEIFDNITSNIIINYGGYTYTSYKYPQIISCYTKLHDFLINIKIPFSINMITKFSIVEKAIEIDLYDNVLFLKNKNSFYNFIERYLSVSYSDYSDFICNIIINNIINLIYNENILDKYKEDFLTQLFNIENVYKNLEILETISEYKFEHESKNMEINRLIELLNNGVKDIFLRKDFIFNELSELDVNNISIRDAYTIISQTKNKDIFNMVLKGIINNNSINIHDKIIFYKELLDNQSIVSNLLDISSFNLIFNQNIYEVNHYTSIIKSFIFVYSKAQDPKFIVNFSNYYEYNFCVQMQFLERYFINIIKKSTSKQLLYLLENSKFVMNNKKLLNRISKHKKIDKNLKEKLNEVFINLNQEDYSIEDRLLSEPITISNSIFDVVKNTKSSIFINLLMSNFNDNISKFNQNDIKYFVKNFLMNINIEPSFIFSDLIINNDEIKILSHIQTLINNISIIIEKDTFYSCEEDLCFVSSTLDGAIEFSKNEFDYFSNLINLCFCDLNGVNSIMQELFIDHDSINDEEKEFCNKYICKMVYQKIKNIAESPLAYSELLHHMVETSWFVQDRLDILEMILENPMCSKETKDLIVNNVFKKKLVEVEELLNIKTKKVLVDVLNNCKIAKKTLIQFVNSEHNFKKSKKVNEAIMNKLNHEKTNVVLNKISKQQLNSLNLALNNFMSNKRGLAI